ncbi:MAG: TrkH family potassium uptake protein [Bacteroidales bacterium]
MNYQVISRYVGVTLLVSAFFMLLSAFVSVCFGMDSGFSGLLISAVITGIAGIFPLIFVRKSDTVTIRDGFAIIIFAWLGTCIFGSIPYVLWGDPFNPINAIFESVSGYTTTGASILEKIESLPKSLLFWRSSTHFIGGLGVIIFMLMVLPTQSTFRFKLSRMEISSLATGDFKYNTQKVIRIITGVYFTIMIACTFSLMLVGMDFYDAINHAFSIVSTGGFSTKDASISSFNSSNIDIVASIFMLISGLHFGLLYALFIKHQTSIFRSPVFKFFMATIIGGTLLITINLSISHVFPTFGESLRHAFFQMTSIGTATGLATCDTNVWPVGSKLILIYMMIQGACAGSTTGGIKADRAYIMILSIKTNIKRNLHPRAIIPIRSNGVNLDNTLINNAIFYIVLYILTWFIGSVLISLTGVNLVESISSSITCMGGVGPGFGECGSLGNYNAFPDFAKIVLMIVMLLGRVEIFSFLMGFIIFRKKRS